MQLSLSQKRYLVREHVIGSGLFNAGLNALLAWLTFGIAGSAPLWGSPGVVPDIISTCFFLPFFVCVIGSPLIAMGVRRGKVEHLDPTVLDASPYGRLPRNLWARAVVLGLIGLISCAPPLAGGVLLLAREAFSVGGYAAFKAVYCGLIAGAVSPVVALFAMLPARAKGVAVAAGGVESSRK